jgi:hypothetical protein
VSGDVRGAAHECMRVAWDLSRSGVTDVGQRPGVLALSSCLHDDEGTKLRNYVSSVDCQYMCVVVLALAKNSSERIATGWLHLDYVGTPVSECGTASRASDSRRQLDHAHTTERVGHAAK